MTTVDMPKRIVIKLGGASLYAQGGFQSSLHSILDEFRHDCVFLIVGGGDLIESMRTVHHRYPQLDQEEMHWRCIELLDYTWEIARQLFPVEVSVSSYPELMRFCESESNPRVGWVRVQSFYRKSDCSSIPIEWLPHADWNATTDALAWLLAKIVDASLVVLLKQCNSDENMPLETAADLGLVDAEIARLASENPAPTPKVQIRSIGNSPSK